MEELKYIAERVQKTFKLNYDEEGIRFIEMFIERKRLEIADDEWVKFINSCGAFLGQCIIEEYGGHWMRNDKAQMIIVLDAFKKVSPFELVVKQFNNGLTNSVYDFYLSIPKASIVQVEVKNKSWVFDLKQIYMKASSLI